MLFSASHTKHSQTNLLPTIKQILLSLLFPTQTSLTYFFFCFLSLQMLHKYFLLCLWNCKRNTWAELPIIITIHCTLVYWSLHNVIGCYIVVPRHWHPSCLHRYPATNTNPASRTLSQERELLKFNAKRYVNVKLMRIKYAKYLHFKVIKHLKPVNRFNTQC